MGDAAMFETVNALTADYRARITELEAALARLRAENGALKMERDEALDRADELERNAEVVSDEFEKDCWKAMRRLLDECNFPWEDIDPAEGVTADSAEEHIKTTLDEMDKGEARQRARAAAAEAKAARLEEALREALEALEPFAKEADEWADTVPDDHRSLCTEPGVRFAYPGSETVFTVGDLRRAKSALTKLDAALAQSAPVKAGG